MIIAKHLAFSHNEILFHFLSYACDTSGNAVPTATLSLDILDLPDHPFQPISFMFA